MLVIQACDNKSCDEIFCGNNANCVNGLCYCQDGFEGSDCGELSYLKYEGSWQVTTFCQAGTSGVLHNSSIYGDGTNRIFLTNFLNSGLDAEVFIRTNTNNLGNVLTIPDQNLGLLTVEGEGEYFASNQRITILVNYNRSGEYKACTLTYYKQ